MDEKRDFLLPRPNARKIRNASATFCAIGYWHRQSRTNHTGWIGHIPARPDVGAMIKEPHYRCPFHKAILLSKELQLP